MFTKKGYCRYCGSKCRHLKVKGTVGRCRKVGHAFLSQTIPKEGNIKAPKWCPKM